MILQLHQKNPAQAGFFIGDAAKYAPMEPTPKPTPPRKPEAHECCGTGCIPCVMDLYEEDLWTYEKELKRWEATQLAKED